MRAIAVNTRNFQPVEALRALQRLLADPDDTEQAFRLVRAMDPGGPERMIARMSSTEEGRALLRDKPALLESLSDVGALGAMPAGSLGRAYLDFCRTEGITPGGLLEASEAGWENADEVDEDVRWMAERMRDSHDLWHLVNGYPTDLVGELSVLGFTFVQTRNAGLGLLVAAGYLRSLTFWDRFGPEHRAVVRQALRRARRAAWLPGVRWEELLPRPLDEVRMHLGVGAPPTYTQVRAADIELGVAS